MNRDELVNKLNEYLNINSFADYCPNGLQVEGSQSINKIVTGVSSSLALFEKAAEVGANAVIVHHGLIWFNNTPLIKGSYKERLKVLLSHDINLLAYHLPLDAHPEIGNNILLAEELGLKKVEPFGQIKDQYIGIKGEIELSEAKVFFETVKNKIKKDPIIFPFGREKIKTIGIISGAAQKEIKKAIDEGLDLYLTGEVSEETFYLAKEEKIHFISAGHHATEKFGIIAITDYIRKNFGIPAEFFDTENPI